MRASEISSRYAKALFDLATESDSRKKVLSDLRGLQQLLDGEQEITNFLGSSAVSAEDKERALKKALVNSGTAELVSDFVLLLAKRNRVQIFADIVEAYQNTSDAAHEMTRGTVRSAKPLSEDEQQAIEDKISKVIDKKVILKYECDPSVVGGMIAEVGGYVFDDTIITHLRRLKEELKRRAH